MRVKPPDVMIGYQSMRQTETASLAAQCQIVLFWFSLFSDYLLIA